MTRIGQEKAERTEKANSKRAEFPTAGKTQSDPEVKKRTLSVLDSQQMATLIVRVDSSRLPKMFIRYRPESSPVSQ